MVKYTDLTPSPDKAMADLTRRLAEKATNQATVPHGVKDMGATGDSLWTRPDGAKVSVREVDTRVEETKRELADSLVRIDAGEAAVSTLRDQTIPALEDTLADLDAKIAAGGTTTVWSTKAPTATDEGVAEGQEWLQTVSDTDATVIGQWRWDGAAWQPVLIRSEVIAALDVSKLTAAETAIAEAVIDKLFAQTFAAHKIAAEQVDAESVAAAVGTFLKINVSQLVADTADMNTVVAQKIAAGIANFVTINAEQINGGAFSGETFVGGTFTGGKFETSDNLPGRVTISDTSGQWNEQTIPGIEIEPIDATDYAANPYIGPTSEGMVMSGGMSTSGATSGAALSKDVSSLFFNGPPLASGGRATAYVQGLSDQASLTYVPDKVGRPGDRTGISAFDGLAMMRAKKGSAYSQITTSPTGSEMYTEDGTGTYSRATADIGRARLQYSSKNSYAHIEVNDSEATIWRDKKVNGKRTRYDIFAFDDNGLTYKQADYDANGNVTNSRWTKFGDSGWNSLPLQSGIVGGSSAPTYRALNSVMYFQGAVQRPAGWTAGWNYIAVLSEDYRPSAPALRVAASTVFNKALIQVNTAGGLEVWLDQAYPGTTNLQLSTMTYPFG